MNERRTVVALLLIGAIMLLTPYYMRLVSPPPPAPADSLAVWTPSAAAPPPAEAIRPAAGEQLSGGRAGGGAEVSDLGQIPAAAADTSGRRIAIETPHYVAEVSTVGAALTGWSLFGFDRGDSGLVPLMPAGARGLVLDLRVEGDPVNGAAMAFESDAPDSVVLAPGESVTLRFTAQAGSIHVERTLVFSGDTYDVRLTDRLEGHTVTPLSNGYGLLWLGGLSFTEPDRREELSYSGFNALQAGDRHRVKLKRDLVEDRISGDIRWAAIRTKYFTAAHLPVGEPYREARMEGAAGDAGPAAMNLLVDRPLTGTDQEVKETILYLGPIDFKNLTSYDADLQKMMDFGFGLIRPISRLVLRVFTFLHNYIPNYGLVIIIFSILVKILVFPLTRKSYESMHAMQELSPRLQEIREKYKDDPEKMNKKMMNLYKEHGVNPLGGCFPLLLQMPVFWALFVVFRATIELRGAPFVGWITDLSLKDPYLILPALMGITMFIQQRAQLKNPQQRALAIIMPIMMFLLLKGLPAGLILYWTMFNILSIIQTELVHKRPEPAATAPAR